MEEMLKKAQAFLSHFSDPVIKMLPIEWHNKIKNIHILRTLEETLAVNNEYPSWVYFTPNWRFWSANTVWDKVTFSSSTSKDETVSALVIDWDLKDFAGQTMEWLLTQIKESCKNIPYKRSFLVKSWWWYHWYWILDPKIREEVRIKYWAKVLKIASELSRQLWWDQNARVSSSISAIIRLPFSYNWKTWHKVLVEVIEDTWEFLDMKAIDNSMAYIARIEKFTKWIQDKTIWDVKLTTDQIEASKIDMPVILNRLEKYPREIDWVKQIFKIVWDNVIIEQSDWTTIKRNSYKYNRWANYINCFYDWDMDKAPVWNGYWFLYHYFCWDRQKVNDFLQEEFWIKSFTAPKAWWLWELTEVFEDYWFKVMFYEWGVVLLKEKTTAKWDSYETTSVIFRNNIKILGKGYTTASNIWEKEASRAYVFEVDWEEMIVVPRPAKRDHNKMYVSKLFFYGEDNDLWLFFSALDRSNKIPEIPIYENSWYYDDKVILWWNLMIWELNESRILPRQEFKVVDDLIEITAKDFLNKYLEIYKPEIAIPTFLQAIALGWMNLREWFNTYPALLITGRTGSGKSAMAGMLKSMLGYAENSRTMSLPGITPQPLKQAASDFSVLFLEELTQKVGESTEELIRNIVNRDMAARGMSDSNVEFSLRSPIFIVWERAFKDESLNNRFLIAASWRNYRQEWSKDKIIQLRKCTAYKDIYSTFLKHQDEVSEMAKGYANKLAEKGLDSRNADTYSFIFVVNDIFKFWYEFDYLFWFVNKSLLKAWLNSKVEDPCWESLSDMILKWILSRQASLTLRDWEDMDWVKHVIYEILYLDESIYQKNRVLINSAITEINEELWENIWIVKDNKIQFVINVLRNWWKLVHEPSEKIKDFFWEILLRTAWAPWVLVSDMSSRLW